MHESRPAACRLPHPKRARACRRRSVEYPYPNYCVTPAAASEVLAKTRGLPCWNLPVRVPCPCPIPGPFPARLACVLRVSARASGVRKMCGSVRLLAGPTTDLGEGSLRLSSQSPISEAVLLVVPEEARTTNRDGKEARIGRRTLANCWPLSLRVSRAHVGVYGGVRILAKPPFDLGEGALQMDGPNQEYQAVLLAAPKEAGSTIRDAKTARIGRQTLANGWPISYTSRARTSGCAEVRGFWPPTTSKSRWRTGRSKVS